jgi:hypothetical protein
MSTGRIAVVVAGVMALSGARSAAPAGDSIDWKTIRNVRGSFAVFVGNAQSPKEAAPLVDTALRGFLVHGTFTLKQVKANPSSVLYQGEASGFLFMGHRAAVLAGEAATSEQTCGGAFRGGQTMVEIFPQEKQYQVAFAGEVSGCRVTTRYPLQEKMAKLFGMSHDYFAKGGQGAYWEEYARLTKGARDEFEAFSKAESRSESVTFSADTMPEIKQVPSGGFPVMTFFSLPATGPAINGSGQLQLAVSTSVMPTVIKANAMWAIEAGK